MNWPRWRGSHATIKAALEDLDGIPIISLNEVPLQGWNSMVKRLMDVAASALLLLACAEPGFAQEEAYDVVAARREAAQG